MTTAPCSRCGQMRNVSPKSLASPICRPCRAIARDVKAAEQLTKLAQLATRPCECCGEQTGRPRSRYCGGACRAKASRDRDPDYPERNRRRVRDEYAPRRAIYFIDCRFCGQLSTVRNRRALRCNKPECVRAFKADRMREGGWAIDVSERRRKRLKRCKAVERIDRRAVFNRDDWTCGICDDPIDREARSPHPLSPSIDHIVPVSLGGDHTTENVRAAHLGCNIRRGNRVVA